MSAHLRLPLSARWRFPAGALLTVGALVVGGAAAGADDTRVLAVGQAARQTVSSPSGGQSGVVVQGAVAADPSHPARALAVAQEGLSETGAGVALTAAVTINGGASWTSRPVPGVTTAAGGRWDGVYWPGAAVGGGGRMYAVADVRGAGCASGLGVVRTEDDGRTWSDLSLAHSDTSCRIIDGRSSLVEDTGARSPHRGRLYLGWTQFDLDDAGALVGQRQVLAHSDDHGRSWSKAVALTGTPVFTQGTTVLVQPDGTVTSVFYGSSDDFATTGLFAQTSRDGGASFAAPVRITTWVISTKGALNVRCCQPSAAVDPVTGELYVALDDARFRRAQSYDDPIVLRSQDGRRWSAPVLANHVPRTSTLEFATPQVAAYDGTVYVSWTLFGSGDRYQQQVTVSRDHGATFGAVSTLGPDGDLRWAAKAAGYGYWLGDITGLAAVRGKAYLAWPLSTRSRKQQHQTLWAAAVTPGAAAPPAATPSPTALEVGSPSGADQAQARRLQQRAEGLGAAPR